MSEEVSLSLEETNKLRASLGLKLIEPKDGIEATNDKGIQERLYEGTPRTAATTPQFIDNDKARMLRRKLSSLKNNGQLSGSVIHDESSSQGDWLSRIGTKPVKISFDTDQDEEEDMPLMKVSHKVEDIASTKGVILTLKESSVLADDDDALENEDLAQEREEAKRVQMRQMNRDRRRMRKKIQVSSADIEQEESAQDDGSVIVIGAAKDYATTPKADRSQHIEGKLRVSFNGSGSEESDGGDFKTVQIKKRKKNGTGSRKRASGVKLPSQIKAVELTNHDTDADLEEDLSMPFSSVKKSRLRVQNTTPEELAAQIAREKREREQRAVQIASNSNHLVIDESTRFLESLKNTVLETVPADDAFESVKETEPAEPALPTPEVAEELQTDQRAPDFYDGLASTLNFVKERNVLSRLQSLPSNPSQPSVQGYRNNAQRTRQSSRVQAQPRYPAGELEVGSHVSELQTEPLQNYDPQVKLEYKDEQGNQLTTKEAYKKLSQKFHGTRSNRKKQAKFQSKIEARKAQQPNNSVFDVL